MYTDLYDTDQSIGGIVYRIEALKICRKVYTRNIQVSCSYCTLSVVYILFCKSWGDYRADLSKVVITQGRTRKMACAKEVFLMLIEGPRAHTHTYTHIGTHASKDTH
jgi:hypothetical protein